jgi:hypothetical protein
VFLGWNDDKEVRKDMLRKATLSPFIKSSLRASLCYVTLCTSSSYGAAGQIWEYCLLGPSFQTERGQGRIETELTVCFATPTGCNNQRFATFGGMTALNAQVLAVLGSEGWEVALSMSPQLNTKAGETILLLKRKRKRH